MANSSTAKQRQVAIVGAGLIGQAWAIVFARSGWNVQLYDANEASLPQARQLVVGQLQELQAQGLISGADEAASRVHVAQDLAQALQNADYVQESSPERLDVKQALFKQLDALAPAHTIIGSSTSSIAASLYTQDLPGRHRCLVAHPVNPPYLVPVVEICGAPWTDASAVQATWDVMVSVGQKPVRIHRDLEGFILNRLQGALLREAFRLVEQGYVDAEGLDVTIREGLGLRWSFMGPFETIDLNAPEGLADYAHRFGAMYQSIAEGQTSTEPWSEALIQKLEAQRRAALPADRLLERRLWRDRRLMGLAAHKKQAERDDG